MLSAKVGHPRGAEDHEGGAEVPTNGPRKTTAAADHRVVPFATQMLWHALQPASFLRTGQPRYRDAWARPASFIEAGFNEEG